jgi:hypothetical protein
MKSKTFDTLNHTTVRLQTILEVDDELEEWQKKAIQKILFVITGILAGENENNKEA